MLFQFLQYKLKAKGANAIHSPFLFKFYNEVIRFKGDATTEKIHQAVKDLKKNRTKVEALDFGAGSRKKNKPDTIASIASTSGTNKRWGDFLYALAKRKTGQTILELGTNLGIGTACLAAGSEKGQIISIEGSSDLTEFAKGFTEEMGYRDIKFVCGKIQDVLQGVLSEAGSIDLVFMDAHHSYEPTLAFFDQLCPFMNNNSIIVIDDIYWSEEMTNAWKAIINSEKVTLSIDLFYKGLVFFDQNLSKQHFILKN